MFWTERLYPLVIKPGNGKSPINGGFNRNITDKLSIYHCHFWLPEGMWVCPCLIATPREGWKRMYVCFTMHCDSRSGETVEKLTQDQSLEGHMCSQQWFEHGQWIWSCCKQNSTNTHIQIHTRIITIDSLAIGGMDNIRYPLIHCISNIFNDQTPWQNSNLTKWVHAISQITQPGNPTWQWVPNPLWNFMDDFATATSVGNMGFPS